MTFPLGNCPGCGKEETSEPCACGYSEPDKTGRKLYLFWFIAAVLWAFFLYADFVHAEPKWVSITLEQTPIVDKRGRAVEKPVFYAKDRRRLTTGGEWVVPKALKMKPIERYQREGKLLMLVAVTGELPGTLKGGVEAEQIKKDVFGMKKPESKPESGVTK